MLKNHKNKLWMSQRQIEQKVKIHKPILELIKRSQLRPRTVRIMNRLTQVMIKQKDLYLTIKNQEIKICSKKIKIKLADVEFTEFTTQQLHE